MKRTLEALKTCLPEAWTAEVQQSPKLARFRPDALLTVKDPEGRAALVIVEAKIQLNPKDVPLAAFQLRRLREELRTSELFPSTSLLLVTPFVSPRARGVLTDLGIGYADPTGNVRLELTRPGLFIFTTGAGRDPDPKETASLRSLKGRGAGRAVRAFCDFLPPYGIRELAAAAKTPAPTLSKVAALLERDVILAREKPRGRVSGVDWRQLLPRWAEDYSFADSNRTATLLEPRGLRVLLDRLRGYTGPYALTGSLAAASLAPITEPRLATIYVPSIDEAATALGLRGAETGGNILLAEPFDPVVFERTITQSSNIVYANPCQVAVDLLTGPGRSPAEGEELLRWMAANETTWRLPIPTS